MSRGRAALGAFAPSWAGGWTPARWLFAAAQAIEGTRQVRQIADSFRHPELNFGSGILHLSDRVLLPPALAWLLGGAVFVGLAGLGWGGRAARPGLLLWMLAELGLFAGLGWELNAPERIAGWCAVGLLLGPIGERDLTARRRSPVGRWFFLLWMSAMYGMTGWLKVSREPGWLDGSILAQALLDPYLGGTDLGARIAAVPALTTALSLATITFELSFPLLVGFAATNPAIVAAGLCFHVGVSSVLNLGTLGITVLSAYPVILHPDAAERLWRAWRR